MRTIRVAGRVSIFVGWMLMGLGVAALVTFVVLGLVVEPWLFSFLFAPVLLFFGGGINLWMGRRARLEVRPDGFIWCGFVGKARSLAWQDVRQILLPPPGARRRLAAVALLRDGRHVEIDALWTSPTSPVALVGAPDHRQAQQLLIDGHRTYLAHSSSPDGTTWEEHSKNQLPCGQPQQPGYAPQQPGPSPGHPPWMQPPAANIGLGVASVVWAGVGLIGHTAMTMYLRLEAVDTHSPAGVVGDGPNDAFTWTVLLIALLGQLLGIIVSVVAMLLGIGARKKRMRRGTTAMVLGIVASAVFLLIGFIQLPLVSLLLDVISQPVSGALVG